LTLLARLLGALSTSQVVPSGLAAGLRLVARRADPTFTQGTYELPIQEAIVSNLDAGDVFFDIGANIGFFSMIAARRVGEGGRVYAFEPVGRNAAAIKRNAELNNLGVIEVFTEAVGSHSHRGELLLAHHIGGAALSSVGPPPDLSGATAIDVVALDDAISRRGLRAPSLVKIDVEGAEIDVLRGMPETLRVCRPTIIYEIDDETREGVDRKGRIIAEFLTASDYTLEPLRPAYPEQGWQVVHILARPAAA
jgi:FkbM family methyltransferase